MSRQKKASLPPLKNNGMDAVLDGNRLPLALWYQLKSFLSNRLLIAAMHRNLSISYRIANTLPDYNCLYLNEIVRLMCYNFVAYYNLEG